MINGLSGLIGEDNTKKLAAAYNTTAYATGSAISSGRELTCSAGLGCFENTPEIIELGDSTIRQLLGLRIASWIAQYMIGFFIPLQAFALLNQMGAGVILCNNIIPNCSQRTSSALKESLNNGTLGYIADRAKDIFASFKNLTQTKG